MSERMLSCTVSHQPGTGSRALLQSIDRLALVAVLSRCSLGLERRRSADGISASRGVSR